VKVFDQLLQLTEKGLVKAGNRLAKPKVQGGTTLEEVTPTLALLSPADGILLGYRRTTPWQNEDYEHPVFVTSGELARHVMLHGRSGSGKSVAMETLLQAQIAQGKGVILFDQDGNQMKRAVGMLAENYSPDTIGGRLLVIDLEDKHSVMPFNILSGGQESVLDHPEESQSLLTLEAISHHFGGGGFGPQVERAMRAAVFTATYAGLTLGDIPRLFTDTAFRMVAVAKADNQSKEFWAHYASLSDEKQQTWASPVTTRIHSWLSVSTLRLMLSATQGLNFRELFARQPDLCIVVNLASRRYAGASRLLAALLWAKIQSDLLHPERIRDDAPSVMLFCDEYQNLVSSEEALLTCLAEARKFKVSLVLGSQIFSRLSTALRDSVMGNTSVQCVFSGTDTSVFVPSIHFEGDPIAKGEIGSFLSRQQVGESILIRPGQYSLPLRHLPPVRLNANAKQIEELILAANRVYARPRHEVEAEIANRYATVINLHIATKKPQDEIPMDAVGQGEEHDARPLAEGNATPSLPKNITPIATKRKNRKPLFTEDTDE
jgi:hypothetical protein